jgi:hypothetical protein
MPAFGRGGLDFAPSRPRRKPQRRSKPSGLRSLSVAFPTFPPKSNAAKRTTDYIATAVDTRSKISNRDLLESPYLCSLPTVFQLGFSGLVRGHI